MFPSLPPHYFCNQSIPQLTTQTHSLLRVHEIFSLAFPNLKLSLATHSLVIRWNNFGEGGAQKGADHEALTKEKKSH